MLNNNDITKKIKPAAKNLAYDKPLITRKQHASTPSGLTQTHGDPTKWPSKSSIKSI